MMAVYKVSYVVVGSEHPGAILNQNHLPKMGERVHLGDDEFEVIEVLELMPPRGQFFYIHATVKTTQTQDQTASQTG